MRMQDRTHCPYGHPYSPGNTLRRVVRKRLSDGTHVEYVGRACRICSCAKDAVFHLVVRKGADVRSADVEAILRNREEKYLCT